MQSILATFKYESDPPPLLSGLPNITAWVLAFTMRLLRWVGMYDHIAIGEGGTDCPKFKLSQKTAPMLLFTSRYYLNINIMHSKS